MPLYEYLCRDCNETSEVIQKFSDPELTDCTACGGTLERVVSAPAIRFKGSGWYVNDYARKNSGGGAEKTQSSSDPEKKSTSEKKTKSESQKKPKVA